MSGAAPRPVARLWEVTGGRIGEPGVVEAIRAGFLLRVEETPGYLGRLVIVDRDRRVVRGLSVWESPEALESSWASFAPIAEEMARHASATVGEPRTYEVVYSGFRGVHTRSPTAAEADLMRARVVRFEGGDVASLWVAESLRKHTAESVARAPGCVAALILVDAARQEGLATTIWADDRSRDRTTSLAREAMNAVSTAAHATVVDFSAYDVLYYEQPD